MASPESRNGERTLTAEQTDALILADSLRAEETFKEHSDFCWRNSTRIVKALLAFAAAETTPRSEKGDSIGAAWLADNLTYMKEPLVNAKTGEEIKGEVRWTVWWTGPDAATFREALYRRGQVSTSSSPDKLEAARSAIEPQLLASAKTALQAYEENIGDCGPDWAIPMGNLRRAIKAASSHVEPKEIRIFDEPGKFSQEFVDAARPSVEPKETLDMSPEARLKDAQADVLRLHDEKMKFFERTIVLERELAETRAKYERLQQSAVGWQERLASSSIEPPKGENMPGELEQVYRDLMSGDLVVVRNWFKDDPYADQPASQTLCRHLGAAQYANLATLHDALGVLVGFKIISHEDRIRLTRKFMDDRPEFKASVAKAIGGEVIAPVGGKNDG